MPNFTQDWNDYGVLLTRLESTPGLNVQAELAKRRDTLQSDFTAAGTIN
jgi:hypothetical protein